MASSSRASSPITEAEASVFASLSDPTRRQLVQWLSEGGPATATELARRLPISRQAVAKHLVILQASGLVTPTKDGRDVRFRLQAGPLTGAMEWMAALAARWDERLEALSRLLGSSGEQDARRLR
jgi:DNA-binding transcriptional ArsR family regulator